MNEVIECMDIGGTNFRIALIQNGKILAQESMPSILGNPEQFIEQIKNTSKKIQANNPNYKIAFTVIGLPGPVKENILLNSAPLKITTKIDFKELEKFFDFHLKVENDLNLAVRAENEFGIGKKHKNFYLLTISTGIGAGIVLDGKMVKGTSGEFGHCILDTSENAILCGCGKKGCWITFSGGQGIQLQAGKKFQKKLSAEDVFELAKQKNQTAIEIIQAAREGNAHGIGSMVNALEVEEIVVMGSIGIKQFDAIIPSEKEIQKFTVNPIPRISKTELGENIGLIGAYCAGIQELKKL